MRTTGRRKTTSHAWKKQGPGKNSACPLISSRSPHTRSDQSEPTFLRGNPAHGRAAFSRRANRRITLRIFCFAGSCQRPPKARRRCVRERPWKPLLRVCVGVSHVDDCCQNIELSSGG